MPWTYQSTLTNPAIAQPARFQLTVPIPIPTTGIDLYHSGIKITDLVEDPQADILTITPGAAIDAMPDESFLRGRSEVLLLASAFHLGKWQFGLHLSNHTEFMFGYHRDLFTLISDGVGAHRGDELQLAPNLGISNYNQYAASASRSIGEKWRIGARVKLLGGVFHASTLPEHQSLTFAPSGENEDIHVGIDYAIRASTGLELGVEDWSQIGDQGINFQPEGLTGLNNPGIALDLGLQFEPIKNLVISASVVDLGQIKWQRLAQSYYFTGDYTFEGLPGFNEDGINLSDPTWKNPAEAWASALDTLNGSFSYAQESSPFTTSLPTRGYLTAQYRLFKILSVGAAWTGELYRETPTHAVSAWTGLHLGKWLTLGANYTYDQRYQDMLGVHGRLNLGPMQFYASAGNILPLIDPYSTQSVSLILGSNYTFGRKKEKK